ncbi:MAG: CYTH domain-containing protein [bacterium]|nr:CYTH domain-containing protein [bacterium]
MPQEIERKFRIKVGAWPRPESHQEISQGYLNSAKERIVRVRVTGKQAWLTIKGLTSGATRLEFEYEIPIDEGRHMLNELCERPILSKTRYRVPVGRHVWEIDEFSGANAGLVVAEIELASEDEEFEMPDWVVEEVTDDPRYFNSNLLQHPFGDWE